VCVGQVQRRERIPCARGRGRKEREMADVDKGQHETRIPMASHRSSTHTHRRHAHKCEQKNRIFAIRPYPLCTSLNPPPFPSPPFSLSLKRLRLPQPIALYFPLVTPTHIVFFLSLECRNKPSSSHMFFLLRTIKKIRIDNLSVFLRNNHDVIIMYFITWNKRGTYEESSTNKSM